MSQITTHILNTSTGKPAAGVAVEIQQKKNEEWKAIANGITNNDGRLTNLLADNKILEAGIYRLIFETKAYFHLNSIQSFYPRVIVEFEIADSSHYHIPLLLNPFGYSTYRGS